MQERKTKRTMMVVTAVMMAMALAAGLAGCGEPYDPTGLVKANLDYLTTGEITDEILSETRQSEEELERIYEEELTDAVDSFVAEIKGKAELEITEEMRTDVREFIVMALKKSKYEVKEEFSEQDGNYIVNVDVYPMDFLSTAEEWIAEEKYLAEWKKKIKNGKYVYTTDEQLIEDFYHYMLDKIAGFIDETGYRDPASMAVKVEKTGEGMYAPDQEDLEAIGAVLLGE